MSNLTANQTRLPPEQEAIRAKCFHPTGKFEDFPREEIEQSIPERFDKMAAKYPSRLAIKTKTHTVTYDELNKLANRVARAILAQRPDGNEPIALLLEQGASPIVAILGVLKAGKIYVPLDPSSPRAGTMHILRDSQSSLIVTDDLNVALARELAQNRCQLLNIDESDSNFSAEELGLSISPDTLAYIIYTSGSTGQPKGVIQTHRNVLHHIMNFINALHISADDRLTNLHLLSHSAARLDIFGALLNGAAVYPFNVKDEGLTHLAGWLTQEEISIYHWIPTGFRAFADTLDQSQSFCDVRVVVLGSEPAYRSDLDLFKKSFPRHCIFVNRLGATEMGNVCFYFADRETRISDNNVPVGHTVPEAEVLLLDDAGEKVGFNCIGEIAIKSRYLSPGYWRKPELTKTVFLSAGEGEQIYRTGDLGRNRPDGCLEYFGRKGFQRKVRGHAIESSEVEAALFGVSGIKEAVVVTRESPSGDQRLVAYLVPRHGSVPSPRSLRSALAEKLPVYMVPSAFVVMKALPRTPNGKVDRHRLPPPSSTRPALGAAFIVARTPIEARLAEIWSEVLSIDQVGVNDNFLDLGGHSLAATRVVSKVLKEFQVDLPLEFLFKSPTVAEMAAVITEHQAKKIEKLELERILAELESISEEKARQFLGDAMATKTTTEPDE